ncbi:bifunctional heptose 7-phosphate kinase/heptose 1-phosphate adenyltransferase [Carboxylicivirga sp. N1Y90]|uniref:bifunctional heptose 7-phosphate kinase/heptose 1-phosphate adenyltransferase n=1 Tax=Carboxylicivirga fragile TaxID=3417571 RepID=UPI003D34AD60|nr:hypothetical protein [Marinilabiliaceae bacterium N1Y90]
MTRSEFSQLFDGFDNMHILVVGDVMIDSYLWGDVTRISPEAPVPILATTGRENRLGGAANVALNIQSLGAIPIMCSVIGKDDAGAIFRELLEKRQLPADGIIASSKRKTTIKTRIISHNQHVLRVDEEEDNELNQELEKKLQEHIIELLNTYKIDALVFEDYDKGTLTKKLIEQTVTIANEKGIPTLVDPKKRNFLAYSNVSFFKPNFKEFREGLKLDLDNNDENELIKSARHFLIDQNMDNIMVTMAEKGVMILNKDKQYLIPAEIRKIADVSGAGDTVISASTLALASGLTPKLVAGIANLAGGLVCEHSGVVPIDKNELLEECFIKLASQ